MDFKYKQSYSNNRLITMKTYVFACSGGAGPSASKVMSRLAPKISEKGQDSRGPQLLIAIKLAFKILKTN